MAVVKRLLLIVGEGADVLRLSKAANGHWEEIRIFPLTSNVSDINQLRCCLTADGHADVTVDNSARLVDEEVSRLRNALGPWLSKISELKLEGRSLKDVLSLRGIPLSAWWLSLVVERSPVKHAAFLQIAQIRAIRLCLLSTEFHTCLTAVNDNPLEVALALSCQKRHTIVRHLGSGGKVSFAGALKRGLRNLGGLGHLITGVLAWLRLCHKIWMARYLLGRPLPIAKREHELVFVSYFPAFEQEAATRGQFRNKYAGPLQALLTHLNRPVIWLLIYTTLNETSYRQAVAQVKHFVTSGEPMILLEQYCGLSSCFRIMGLYFQLAYRARAIYPKIAHECFDDGPIPSEAEPLWRSLWQASFIGNEAVTSLFFAVAFQQAAGDLAPRAQDCLYYWEMQSWEKALCAAWKESGGKNAIAFQHASLPRNLWSCFPDPGETARHGLPTDLPLPDILATGGPIPESMISPSKFPHLVQVESIRYLYLNGVKTKSSVKGRRPALVVAGSIDRSESLALIRLVIALGPPPENFRILLKGHPSMPLGPLLRQYGIDPLPDRFEVWDGDLGGALDAAWIALVSASTVALEALAHGCRVIAPVFPDAIQLNPVAEFEGWCIKVSSPDELREAMVALIRTGATADHESSWNFVKNYWNLSEDLSAWTALLRK